MLLSKDGEKNPDNRWTFVPTGIHLIESPDIVKSALRTQNEYCANVTAVTIEGITEQMMFNGGPQGATIEALIRANCEGLVSIERTTHLNSRGKWHFLVQIQHQHTVRHYILQHIIPDLERNGLPSNN